MIAPLSFASWILRAADAMEPLLDAQDWDRFLDLELIAAEFTSDHLDESTFRHKVNAAMGRPWDDGGLRPRVFVIDLRSHTIRSVA
jgi:hypothetical protein